MGCPVLAQNKAAFPNGDKGQQPAPASASASAYTLTYLHPHEHPFIIISDVADARLSEGPFPSPSNASGRYQLLPR